MDEFMVRLNGKPKEYVDKFLEQGYFNTKSEVVRLGIMELASKYKLECDEYVPSKEELKLVGKAVERELKKNKGKFYTEKEFLDMYPHLKKIKK